MLLSNLIRPLQRGEISTTRDDEVGPAMRGNVATISWLWQVMPLHACMCNYLERQFRIDNIQRSFHAPFRTITEITCLDKIH